MRIQINHISKTKNKGFKAIKISGKKEYILLVFNKEENDSDYPVISSESQNPFKIWF